MYTKITKESIIYEAIKSRLIGVLFPASPNTFFFKQKTKINSIPVYHYRYRYRYYYLSAMLGKNQATAYKGFNPLLWQPPLKWGDFPVPFQCGAGKFRPGGVINFCWALELLLLRENGVNSIPTCKPDFRACSGAEENRASEWDLESLLGSLLDTRVANMWNDSSPQDRFLKMCFFVFLRIGSLVCSSSRSAYWNGIYILHGAGLRISVSISKRQQREIHIRAKRGGKGERDFFAKTSLPSVFGVFLSLLLVFHPSPKVRDSQTQ